MFGFKSFLIESSLLLENRVKFLAQQAKMPEEHVQLLADYDPNPKKKNLNWLVRQHKNGSIGAHETFGLHPDHLHAHSEALKRFEDMKKAEPNSAKHIGDIMQYKSTSALHDKMDEWENVHSPAKKFGEKVFEKDGHAIYHAATPTQATNHGAGTSWCTRMSGGDYQTHYLEKGNLYVHYPNHAKHPGSEDHINDRGRHQFWIPKNPNGHAPPELKNVSNLGVPAYKHEENHPVLAQSKHWNQFKEMVGKHEEQEHEHEEDEEEDPDDAHERERDRLATSPNVHHRVESIEYGAHHYHDHLWAEDEHHSVHEAILDSAYDTNDTGHGGEIHDTEHRLMAHNDSLVHEHIAAKTPHADTAQYIYDHAREHGDDGTISTLAGNKQWHRDSEDQENAKYVAGELAKHEDRDIRHNVAKASNIRTFPTVAHAILDHEDESHHRTILHVGAKTNAMREHGEGDEHVANELFEKMKNHKNYAFQAEYAKHNLDAARQDPKFVNHHSETVQEAMRWDDADYLHTRYNDQARIQAAKIGTDKHHDVLMNDHNDSVRKAAFKYGSIATKVKFHADKQNQPLAVQREIENHRSDDLANALVDTDQPHLIQRGIRMTANYDVHRRAVQHSDASVRHAAIMNTNDRKTVEHAAEHDPEERNRETARNRLDRSGWMLRDNPGEVR